MEKAIDIVLDPFLEMTLPKEYLPWIDLLEKYICRAIGVTIAWAVQFYNSLLHCAVAGSLIFSRALVPFLNQRGVLHVENLEDTYIDEIIGWAVAVFSIFVLPLWFQASFPIQCYSFTSSGCRMDSSSLRFRRYLCKQLHHVSDSLGSSLSFSVFSFMRS